MIKSILIVVLVVNFGSYFWSVYGVFRRYPNQMKADYRLLQLGSLLTWFACVYEVIAITTKDNPYISVAIVLELGFGLLYWWASTIARSRRFTIAYSLDSPEVVVSDGPYSLIRHPCYTAYMGSYFTAALITQGSLSLVMSFVMLLIYWRAARLEESKFQNSSLDSHYSDYKRRTGMFLPKLWRRGA